MSDESELRALEARVYQLPVATLEQRVAAVEQAMPQLWAMLGARSLCAITFVFRVSDSSTGAAISGATVDVISSLGATVASGSTDGSGALTLIVFGLDSYTYSVGSSGYTTATGGLSASCGDTVETAVGLMTAGCTTTFTGTFIAACTSTPMAGATITIDDTATGANYYTGTTDGSGNFSGTWTAPSGTAVTITGTTVDGFTSSITSTQGCGGAVYHLAPNWSYCSTTRMPATLTCHYSGVFFGTGTTTLTQSGCAWHGSAGGATFVMGWDSGVSNWGVEVTEPGGGIQDADATGVSCSSFSATFTNTFWTLTVTA